MSLRRVRTVAWAIWARALVVGVAIARLIILFWSVIRPIAALSLRYQALLPFTAIYILVAGYLSTTRPQGFFERSYVSSTIPRDLPAVVQPAPDFGRSRPTPFPLASRVHMGVSSSGREWAWRISGPRHAGCAGHTGATGAASAGGVDASAWPWRASSPRAGGGRRRTGRTGCRTPSRGTRRGRCGRLADGWMSAVSTRGPWGLIVVFIVVERLWPVERNGGC